MDAILDATELDIDEQPRTPIHHLVLFVDKLLLDTHDSKGKAIPFSYLNPPNKQRDPIHEPHLLIADESQRDLIPHLALP